jgi:8-oxo-dGTP diphosphatase
MLSRLCGFSLVLSPLFATESGGGGLSKPPWHVPIGVGILVVREEQVLLLKRAYIDWGYGVIAGELEKGETLRQSAIRHAEKEAGVTTDEDNLRFICSVHYKTTDTSEAPLVFFFSTEKWSGSPYNKEPHRHSEMRWFPLDQLPEHLAPGEDLVLRAYKCPEKNEGYYERGWDATEKRC